MKLKLDPSDNPKLIIERLFSKGASKLTGTLYQVYRQVYSICSVSTVHYNGSKEEISDFEELLSAMSIGQQTFKNYGIEARELSYSGFDNVVKVPDIQKFLPKSVQNMVTIKQRYIFNTVSGLYTYGHDPIPALKLYNNKNVTFSSAGGFEEPFAIATYDPIHGKLHVPGSAEYDEIFNRFESSLTAQQAAELYIANKKK